MSRLAKRVGTLPHATSNGTTQAPARELQAAQTTSAKGVRSVLVTGKGLSDVLELATSSCASPDLAVGIVVGA